VNLHIRPAVEHDERINGVSDMRFLRAPRLWISLLVLAVLWPFSLGAEELVSFPTDAGSVPINSWLFKPSGPGPFPAVIALHGCGGPTVKGALDRRIVEWAGILVEHGYMVLAPDSFGSRGLGSQCSNPQRDVRASRERLADASAALRFLTARGDVKPDSINLLGWSNGGSTALWTAGHVPAIAFATVTAFYPGCTSVLDAAHKDRWALGPPLLLLIGEADNWTPAAPCRDLIDLASAKGRKASIVLYPETYHDFDSPGIRQRERRGLAYTADGSGRAMVGPNPAARADAVDRVLAFLKH